MSGTASVEAAEGVRLSANHADAAPGIVARTPCASWSDIRAVICGQSQAWAIVHALVRDHDGGAPSHGPETARRLGIAGLGGGPKDDAYFALAQRLAATRHLAVVWNGNQHNADFLLAPDPLLDFVPRSLPDCALEPRADLVPEAAVRAHFAPSMERLEAFIVACGRPPGRLRCIMGTPPPLFDTELIRRRLRHEPLFAARAKAMGGDLATMPITPGPIRRKLWLVLQELMAEIADRAGAVFIPAPGGCMDEHGCLRPDFSMGDVTHASLGYGILALADLARHLDQA